MASLTAGITALPDLCDCLDIRIPRARKGRFIRYEMKTHNCTRGTIYSGEHAPYFWLTSVQQYIDSLLRLCPDVVIGRFIAVTSIDSGVPWLTETQQHSGWQLRNGIAYSRQIKNLEELKYQIDGPDSPGYDEWYVFDVPQPDLGELLQGNPFEEEHQPGPGRVVAFVNWMAFVLHDDSGTQVINDMFWQQLDWINPDLYIGDGSEGLTVVCKDERLFSSIRDRLILALQ